MGKRIKPWLRQQLSCRQIEDKEEKFKVLNPKEEQLSNEDNLNTAFVLGDYKSSAINKDEKKTFIDDEKTYKTKVTVPKLIKKPKPASEDLMEKDKINKLKEEDKDINKSTESADSGVGNLSSSDDSLEELPSQRERDKLSINQKWTFGVLSDGKNVSNWQKKFDVFASVETLEDFWQVYGYLGPASEVSTGCDVSMFRAGIRPAWEDHQNESGGRWILEIRLDRYLGLVLASASYIDGLWTNTLMVLFKNMLTPYNHIVNGACISHRRNVFKIAVWLKDARDNLDGVRHVGRMLKEQLGIPQQKKILYSVHAEEKMKHSGRPYQKLPNIYI